MTSNAPRDDQPFDFNLEAFVKGMEAAPFRFQWGDRRWTFEHIDALDSWVMVKVNDGNPLQVFKAAMGEQAFAEFQKIPLPQGGLKELFRRYLMHCGIDPEKVPGFADS